MIMEEGHRLYSKVFPEWKLERWVYLEGKKYAWVMLNSHSQKRIVCYFAKEDIVTAKEPKDQSVCIPQFIVDGLSMKDQSVVIIFRLKIFEVSCKEILQSQGLRRVEIDGTNCYMFTLRSANAIDWTSGKARATKDAVIQQTIFADNAEG